MNCPKCGAEESMSGLTTLVEHLSKMSKRRVAYKDVEATRWAVQKIAELTAQVERLTAENERLREERRPASEEAVRIVIGVRKSNRKGSA